MLEITDLLGRASCEMQGTDNFPWVFVTVIKNLKQKLEYIRKCFSEGLIPDITPESYEVYCPNHLGKPQWSVMQNNLPSDTRPVFQKIPVVISGEFDNRPLRRYTSKNVDKSERTINGEVKQVLKNVADTYITNLIKYIDDYFFTGKNPSGVNTELPHWISLAKMH